MFNLIVVGTDGSASATRAVTTGIDLARRCDAKLLVVSAYTEDARVPPEAEVVDVPIGPGADAHAIASAAKHEAEAAGVTVETRAVSGHPAEVLLSLAEEQGADLIVVGNKGMSGVQRFVLGSVPNKISHHASCSVLIAHTN